MNKIHVDTRLFYHLLSENQQQTVSNQAFRESKVTLRLLAAQGIGAPTPVLVKANSSRKYLLDL